MITVHLLAPAAERDVVDAGATGRRAGPLAGPLAVAAAVVAAATAVAVHLLAAWTPHGPVWTDDVIGVLATARLLAGVGEPFELAHMSYYPGWAIVLVPLWWLLDDPATVYRAAVLVSAMCGIVLMVPLAWLARRMGLTTPLAVVAAAVVTAAPGRTVMSSYAVTENFLTLMIAVTAVVAVRYGSWPALSRAILFGACAGAVFVVHGRAVGVLGMACVWFAADVLRGRARTALPGLAAALLVAGSGFALHLWVSGQIYDSAVGRESNALSAFAVLRPWTVAMSAAGQSWYPAAAWLSLPFLGLWYVVHRCRREGIRGAGIGWWGLGVFVASVVITVPPIAKAFNRGSGRVDIAAYGRYLEPVVTVLALVGLAYLVRGASRRSVWVVAALTAGIGAFFLLWAVPQINRGGWWGPINMAGLMGRPWPPQLDPGPAPWPVFTLTAVVATVAYVVLRRHAWLLLVPLLGYFALSSTLAQTRYLGELNVGLGEAPDLVEVVEGMDPQTLSYDTFGADWVGQNSFQFWLADRDVEVFNSSIERAPTDLVIARRHWVAGDRQGAVQLAGSRRDESLWVMPGDLAERLDAQGTLDPVPPGRPLPDYSYDLELDPARPLDVGDDTAELDLEVTNLGDTVWPALGTIEGAAGTVRLLLEWPTADGVEQHLVELPHSVVPGDDADVEAVVDVPDDVVATGPLRVLLVHEGVGLFEGDAGEPLAVPLTGVG